MKKLIAISCMALTMGIASAVTPQATGLKVPVPTGFENFFPFGSSGADQPVEAGSGAALPGLTKGTAFKAPSMAAQASESMYAYLSNTNLADLKHAMYTIDFDGGRQFLWQDSLTAWGWTVYTGWLRDGDFWGLAGVKLNGQFMGYALMQFDLDNGNIKTIDYIDLQEEGMQSVFVSSAYRLMDDMVYGYSYDEEGENMTFAMAPATDFHNVKILRTVKFEDVCASMTYDSLTDTMYGVTTSGQFVSIDKLGNQTVIYNLSKAMPGIQTTVASGMGWYPSMGACIYDAYYYDGYTGLVALDPSTKSPVALCEDDGAIIYSSLFSTEVNAKPTAPMKPEFLYANFPYGSLNGDINWTIPNKCVDGTPISGTLAFDFYVDGEKVGSGGGFAGVPIGFNYSDVVTNGQHSFSAICRNVNEECSEPDVYRAWIGPDAPLAPTNVKLNENTVSWDIPEGSVHDGYVDYEDINYTVYLNGGKIGDTKSTSLSYTLPSGEPFTSYTAEVVATYKGWSSPRGVSNYIQYGEPLKMPVHFRPEEKELELMTMINVDGHVYDDGTEDTWRFTTEMGFPSFASGYNGDDWLILPPMIFDNTEKAYRFEMEIGLIHDVDTTGTYEVFIGKEPTAEAMTRVIILESRCYHMLGDIIEEFFAVPEPGVYYIGIHTKTNQVSFHVSDMDVTLSDRPATVPVGVTNMKAIPADGAELSATVSFTMPKMTAAGSPLPADEELTAIVSSYATEPGYNKDRELVETKSVKGLPGSNQSVVISTAQNYNAIVVAVESDGLTGKGEETLIYTGVVRPYIVNDLKATISEDNMTITLTWTPPTEGEEEGEIGDSFLYVIYDYESTSWVFLDEAGWDVYEYSYTVDNDFELGYFTIGVMAYNAAGLSYHVAGKTATLGHPVELPWTNDLDNDLTYNNASPIVVDDRYADTYWLPGDPGILISPIFSLPSEMALIGYTDQTNRMTRLSLPKVTTAGLHDVKLSFDYWAGDYAAQMYLMAQTYGMDEPIRIATLPRAAKGWTTYEMDLPEQFQDCGWVALFVEAELPDSQAFAMFSGYSFTTVSGVNGVISDASIIGDKGLMTVRGHADEMLTVTDLQGRVVLQRDRLNAHSVFVLPAGVYIVRAGDTTVKTIIR